MSKGLGAFPADGKEARRTGTFYKIKPEDGLKVVSGRKTPALLNLFVSNDVVQFGEITMPSGGIGPRQTEFDTHKGDAVFYVTEGPIVFFMKESREVFEVGADEFMFIPKGIEYKAINYQGHAVKAVFIVAPEF